MPLCKFHFILESRWIHRYFTVGITDGLWLKVTYFNISSKGYNDYLGGTHCEYLPDIQPFNNYHQQRDTPLSCLSTMRAQRLLTTAKLCVLIIHEFQTFITIRVHNKDGRHASLETPYCFILSSYSSVNFGLTSLLLIIPAVRGMMWSRAYQLLEVKSQKLLRFYQWVLSQNMHFIHAIHLFLLEWLSIAS